MDRRQGQIIKEDIDEFDFVKMNNLGRVKKIINKVKNDYVGKFCNLCYRKRISFFDI